MEDFELLFFCAFLPSVVFWTCAGALHLCGVNRHYNGPVMLSEMIRSQLTVDVLQTAGALMRLYVLGHTSTRCSIFNIILGVLGIDLVEYWLHRSEHRIVALYIIHKQHHRLVPVHTLGTFYNDWRQILFDASVLSLLILCLDLTMVEVAVVSSIAVIGTVHDHWPSAPHQPLTRHERHHQSGPNADFSQPFSGFWDWVFGTQVKDSYPLRVDNQPSFKGRTD